MYFHLYVQFKIVQLIEVENGSYQGLGEGENGQMMVKSIKFQVCKIISSGSLLYSIVPMAKNTVLHT